MERESISVCGENRRSLGCDVVEYFFNNPPRNYNLLNALQNPSVLSKTTFDTVYSIISSSSINIFTAKLINLTFKRSNKSYRIRTPGSVCPQLCKQYFNLGAKRTVLYAAENDYRNVIPGNLEFLASGVDRVGYLCR